MGLSSWPAVRMVPPKVAALHANGTPGEACGSWANAGVKSMTSAARTSAAMAPRRANPDVSGPPAGTAGSASTSTGAEPSALSTSSASLAVTAACWSGQ
jgi:hypothetical protein